MYHDQSTIFVGLFTQCVQFGDGIVKCLFGKMASSIGRIQNLVVEDGEIESKTEADLLVNTASFEGKKGRKGEYWMCGWEFCDSNVGRCFVCFEGFIGAVFAFVTESKFGKVTMIISFPIEISTIHNQY
jgi:hypothetical protein